MDLNTDPEEVLAVGVVEGGVGELDDIRLSEPGEIKDDRQT